MPTITDLCNSLVPYTDYIYNSPSLPLRFLVKGEIEITSVVQVLEYIAFTKYIEISLSKPLICVYAEILNLVSSTLKVEEKQFDQFLISRKA